VQWWVIWLVIAGVLGIAELLTMTLALAMIAGAALVAAISAAAGLPLPAQLGVFAVAVAVAMGLVWPAARRHSRQPPRLRTGTAALVGRSALVLEDVSAHSGRVRIGGEEWSGRSYDESLVIPAGTTVDVMKIDGAMALVYPRE
jgi:membrane protein implicated in regulation of membrane protease activity